MQSENNENLAFSTLQSENNETNKKISITDNLGKIIYIEKINKNSAAILINSNNFAKGIYTINLIENGKIIESQMIVIE